MTRDSLIGLAERCEQAEGPNFRLEQEIMWAVRGILPRHQSEFDKPPAYTASVDAAMSLVPKGWRMAQLFERNRSLPNWIWKAELWNPEADETVRGIARNADLPALALCAAALRARAASLNPDGKGEGE